MRVGVDFSAAVGNAGRGVTLLLQCAQGVFFGVVPRFLGEGLTRCQCPRGARSGFLARGGLAGMALLNVAEKFNLAAPAQIAALRGTFNSQLEKIVGKELSPRQVAQLHKLLTQFNPAKPA